MRQGRNRRAPSPFFSAPSDERRIRASVYLRQLTVADGAWLESLLPRLQRNVSAQAGSVRVEDVVLRYRPGRLGIADAMDATAALLRPFSTAGAALEHRGAWYIADEDDDDDDDDDTHSANLKDLPEQDLLVSARVIIDAPVEDAGAAALYWAVLALANA